MDFGNVIEGKYRVSHIVFPNSLNNIIANYNDILYLNTGNVTLAEGLYTSGTSLAAYIQTLLIPELGSPTCTFNTSSQKFTITADESVQLMFSNPVRSCRKLLGFSAVNTSWTTSHTSDIAVDSAPTKSVLINIKECKNKNIDTPATTSVVGNIYVAVRENFGTVINQTYNEIAQDIEFTRTSTLNIRCIDVDNRTLDLRDQDWEMLLTKIE
jgi:hypothetical protein